MGGFDFDLRPFFWFLFLCGCLFGACSGFVGYQIHKHVRVEVRP
jgi:hypothetical protein